MFGPGLELGVSNGPFVRRCSARLRCNARWKNATKSATITPRTSPMPTLEIIETVINAFAASIVCAISGGPNFIFCSSVLKNHPRRSGKTLAETLEFHRFVKSSSGKQPLLNCQLSLAVEALAGSPLELHTCLTSRISMASTCGSLRQRLALRSAIARFPSYSAWLHAATPLGQNLLGGCAAKWITTQCE